MPTLHYSQTFNLVRRASPARINPTIPYWIGDSRFSIENNYQSSTQAIAHFLVGNAHPTWLFWHITPLQGRREEIPDATEKFLQNM